MSSDRDGIIRRTWEVACALCGESEPGFGYPTDAVRVLRAEGWRKRKGKWVCPECMVHVRESAEP